MESRIRNMAQKLGVSYAIRIKGQSNLFLIIMVPLGDGNIDRKSTRLNSSHSGESRMPSSA